MEWNTGDWMTDWQTD